MNVSGYLQGSESSVALNFNSVFASDFKKVKYTQKCDMNYLQNIYKKCDMELSSNILTWFIRYTS
jgi:hypothetical protein